MNTYFREPFNSLSHWIGALLSIAGFVLLLMKATTLENPTLPVVAVVIFGISMILLYSASGLYHMIIAKDSVIAFFRRLDHSMIFVLIAGSYAPFCLVALRDTTGIVVFTVVSVVAILGIIFKMVWFHAPRWVSTSLYIGLGWIIIFLSGRLAEVLSSTGLFFLVLGGIMYTIGGIIYGLKPKFMENLILGYHEIFHLFILLGTASHFVSVYLYVLK
ncbi:PAQR family membrane homeostasis protein TrhA [Paenisporosarcina cavernae]|uniref:Hemolysin III family protein n=1 Tax=Paenisporosarcina cavernae TaxID=2320858 RepID=A0A385YRJ0_9BACL|nr:hemolysin III family protein [Paenisporosarcina cavernae]AYC28617.1 hemolysin III family protein [Paenisporosarcina cavernae]